MTLDCEQSNYNDTHIIPLCVCNSSALIIYDRAKQKVRLGFNPISRNACFSIRAVKKEANKF
jgi:hypothetical protein